MSNISVDYDVLNQRGSPAWFSDVYANIPTAGYKGRMFISIDTYAFYRDTGTGWDLIGGPGTGTITGSGATGQVSFFNGSSTLAGSNNLFWDNTNSRLGIGTTTPGAPLDIHATGTNAQFNGTGSNNAYLVFQNAGTSKWRIGNTFSSPNSFDIYNNATTTNALSISSSNILSFIGVSNFDEVIRLKQNLLSYATSSGYTTMFSTTGGGLYTLGFYNGGGALSQISFTTAASYSYVFPSASGTLALTSNLSSYVPYTGATTSVDLGTNSITAIQLIASASGGNAPGYLLYYNSTLYASISSTATYFQFNSNTSAGYLFKNSSGTDIFRITNSGQIGNGINTYTLPSSNGTLALTSDLSSYLPLTGGTLTGQLYINPTNTGTIGLDVASDTIRFRSDNLEGFKRQLEITMGSGTLVQLTAKGYSANYGTDMAFYTATTGGTNASPGIYITGTNNRVGIKTGTPAYDLDLNGTFGLSGLLTSTAFGTNNFSSGGTGYNKLTIRNTTAGAANGAQLSIGSNADPDQFYVQSFSTTFSTSGMNIAGGAVINGEGPGGLNLAATQSSIGFYTNGSASGNLRMLIDSTGVVQVGNAVAATNVSFDINGVANKAGRIRFLESGAAQWLLGNGAASENGRFEVYDNSGGTGVQLLRGATAWIPLTSDVRLKKNFETTQGLNEILQIEPIKYNLLSEDDSTTKKLGFKAQNLQTLIPEMVVTNGRKADDGSDYLTIVPDYILPVLVKAIQELNEKLVRNNIN